MAKREGPTLTDRIVVMNAVAKRNLANEAQAALGRELAEMVLATHDNKLGSSCACRLCRKARKILVKEAK